MRLFSSLILLIVIFLGLSFSSLNNEQVVFNYYFGTKNIALSLLLILALGCGILIGFLVAIASWVKLKRDNLKIKSRLKMVEKELTNLRSIPIKDE